MTQNALLLSNNCNCFRFFWNLVL